MQWFPIGPDFVFIPRRNSFQRLSRRNERGEQGRVTDIAIDPSDSKVIYVVESTGGSAGGRSLWAPGGIGGAFRTDDGGNHWLPIADSIHQTNPADYSSCLVLDPVDSRTVYMGTYSDLGAGSAVYVSNNRGQSWAPRRPIPGTMTKIIVDARNTTKLYAATSSGVFYSTDGGATWQQSALTGDVTSLIATLLPNDTYTVYAAVANQGVFFTSDPTSRTAWTSMNNGILSLAGNRMLLDFCRINPLVLYLCAANNAGTCQLYASTSGGRWIPKPLSGMPTLGIGYDAFTFAVAPNSPGDGSGNDILLLGEVGVHRSIDSGASWQTDQLKYHADTHAFAFFPATPPLGVIPEFYLGCDGGIAKSSRFCDRTFDISTPPADFNEDGSYTNSGSYQNLNHGKQSSLIYRYTSHPAMSTLSYISCQDTGLNSGAGSLGWRGIAEGDAAAVAITAGANGVIVWDGGFSPPALATWTDRGDFTSVFVRATLDSSTGANVGATSNLVVTLDGKCLAGAVIGTSNYVVRVGADSVASRISQDFGSTTTVRLVAASPTNPDIFYCATISGNTERVWVTTSGSTASSSTVWTEVTTIPASLGVGALCVDSAGRAFVLARYRIGANVLYRVDSGGPPWMPQPCMNLPAALAPTDGVFGPLVADPVESGVLHAVHGARVYKLTLMEVTWNWQDISSGPLLANSLPGQWIYSLWIGNIGSAMLPRVLLRAAVFGRGVWECDVTAGAMVPAEWLYLRDHLLEHGWTSPSVDGMPNPFDPANPGATLYHYLCEDIKVDSLQRGAGGSPDFFQTDPEGNPLPIGHVWFDQLRDNSQMLPGSDRSLVHVQVHNRSAVPANKISVWAIYCNAAAGTPGLNLSTSSGNAFDFWNRCFQPNGTIVDALPLDSPWRAVGNPQVLNGIVSSDPQVASWNWMVPALPSGDPGHYCIVAFIHSANSPLTETSFDADVVTVRNRQVGQKNLQIGPPLPPAPGPTPVEMIERVEFHNASLEPREATLVLDFRGLPAELEVSFRLTPLDTARPLEHSMTGVTKVDPHADPAHLPGFHRTRYLAAPSAKVQIHGVRIGPTRAVAALIAVRNTGSLPPSSRYRFQVQQVVGGRTAGGSAYIVPIAG